MRKSVLLLIGIVILFGCRTQVIDKKISIQDERNFLQENTLIYTGLKTVGIEALIDSTEERVLIRFEVLENYSIELSVVSAFSAAAAVTKSDEIIVQVYSGSRKLEEVKAKKQDVLDLVNDKISVENFFGKLDWKKY